MTLSLQELRLFRTDGEVETRAFESGMNLMLGPRNSSKTTHLKVIDFILAESDSVGSSLPTRVVDEYLGAELLAKLGEGRTTHRFRRAFQREFGQLTYVQVDGNTIPAREFGSWLMTQLGWPELDIPKGLNPRLAKETVPLSFRTLLRHIYRKENSWYEFAVREEEFHRRAVVSFFLGTAPYRFSGEEFRIGELERSVTSLEAELRQVEDVLNSTTSRVASEIGLSVTSVDDVARAREEVEAGIEALLAERDAVHQELEATPNYSVDASADYEAAQARVSSLRDRETQLVRVLGEYEASQREVEGQVARIDRVGAALSVFARSPVRHCPVCQHAPPMTERTAAQSGVCYLCGQDATADVRERRATLEKRALEDELAELADVVARTTQGLEATRSEIQTAVQDLRSASEHLDRVRSSAVAPFLTELEEIQESIGANRQRSSILNAMSSLSDRRDSVTTELIRERERLDEAHRAYSRIAQTRTAIAERHSEMAEAMNEFFRALGPSNWPFGTVTISGDDLTFYVGTRPWDAALGAEARVLFFLAYHFGLLAIPESDELPSYSPRLALLDNPLQHGVPDSAVGRGLDQLSEAATNHGGQIICTLPHRVPMDTPRSVINLSRVYGEVRDQDS